MSDDLHARVAAALAEEQARAESLGDMWRVYLTGGVRASAWHGFKDYIAAQDPARTLARVAADWRVLERHQQFESGDWCARCDGPTEDWPCPDVRDLAARYGIEVEP